jgi:hypothetical protein
MENHRGCAPTGPCAIFRKHAGHRQSSVESAAGNGSRKSSSAHQQWPVPTPHSNAVPQRAQARRRGSRAAPTGWLITDI